MKGMAMLKRFLATVCLVAVAGCVGGLDGLGDSPQTTVADTPRTTPPPKATTTSRPADPHFSEECKVLDRTIMDGERWDVSCRVEFDWPSDEDGVYFEVRFFDGDDFQVDFINEIVNLRAGRNKVHLTGWTVSGWSTYRVFSRS